MVGQIEKRHPSVQQLRDASLAWVQEIESEVDEKVRRAVYSACCMIYPVVTVFHSRQGIRDKGGGVDRRVSAEFNEVLLRAVRIQTLALERCTRQGCCRAARCVP